MIDLEPLRKAANALLPDQATIQRFTDVSDGAGGFTQVWATVATTPCRVAPRQSKPQEGGNAGGVQNVTDWLITVPVGTDVRDKDRVTIGGRVFEVAKALVRSFQTAQQVIAVEVA